MFPKKEPLLDCSLEEAKCAMNLEENSTNFSSGKQVHISSRGFVMRQPTTNKPRPENLKKRLAGDIKGWSKESRRRFRRYLMDYREPEGWVNVNLTLTVPGTVMTALQYKDLWRDFTKNLDRKNVLAVWRAEVQQRGAVHWHIILSMHPSEKLHRMKESWFSAIEKLGEISNYKTSGGCVISASSRLAIPSAEERCWVAKPENGSDCWWRYLCDHASKLKQEQIGHDIGRHWGTIGKKHAKPVFSDEVLCLSDDEMMKFRRVVRRLCTPNVKNESSPFGSRLGYAPNLSKNGRVDRFGHSKAVSQYLAWLRRRVEEAPF